MGLLKLCESSIRLNNARVEGLLIQANKILLETYEKPENGDAPLEVCYHVREAMLKMNQYQKSRNGN